MSYDSEAKFEADLIKTLVEEKGWDGGVLEYKNEKEDENAINDMLNELHRSFASLSQEEQKFAN